MFLNFMFTVKSEVKKTQMTAQMDRSNEVLILLSQSETRMSYTL